MGGTEKPLVNPNFPPGSPRSGPEAGRPVTKVTPDTTVYEPESLKRAREIAGMTDEQAQRERRRGLNKGTPVW